MFKMSAISIWPSPSAISHALGSSIFNPAMSQNNNKIIIQWQLKPTYCISELLREILPFTAAIMIENPIMMAAVIYARAVCLSFKFGTKSTGK